MKQVLSFVLLFTVVQSSAQTELKVEEHTWEAPYYLASPAGWGVEHFPIPIAFAPGIPYKGTEDIRFTPGWAKAASNEYWSYAFLWYLDGVHEFDSKTIENHLTAYYTGLFEINTDKAKLDTSKLVPVKVVINPLKPANGDFKTFSGTVVMNDYMKKLPITLNVTVHIKSCEGQNNTFAFFELSPKPLTDPVWTSLHDLWLTFKCSK